MGRLRLDNFTYVYVFMLRPNLYDYLKILALLAMFIDHTGYFLFPEHMRMRAVGRIAFPLFLFLVWFNRSYRWRWSLWWCALGVQVVLRIAYVWSFDVDPRINILLAIALVRVMLHAIQWWSDKKRILLFFVALFLYPFANTLISYGTITIVFALLWYWFAWQRTSWRLFILMILALLTHSVYMLWSEFLWVYTWRQIYALFGVMGILGVSMLLMGRENTVMRTGYYRDTMVLRTSRHALQLYVVHVVVLMMIVYIVNRL